MKNWAMQSTRRSYVHGLLSMKSQKNRHDAPKAEKPCPGVPLLPLMDAGSLEGGLQAGAFAEAMAEKRFFLCILLHCSLKQGTMSLY